MNEDIHTIGNPASASAEEALAVLERTSGSAHFAQIRFARGFFEVNPIPVDEMETTPPRIVTQTGHTHHEAMTQGRVDFQTTIEAKATDPSEPAVRVVVAASFLMDYVFNKPLVDDLVAREIFAKVIGITHAWSFWREFFTSSLGRMQMIANPQPMIDIVRAIRMAGFLPAVELQKRAESASSKSDPTSIE